MDRTQLLEQSIYIPAADTPEDYNPPFQTRDNVINPEFCVPMTSTKRFQNKSITRNLPFENLAMPLSYFSLFFSEAILSQIVEATNSYA